MVRHFETRRGTFRAVDGVDVEMAPGTITALLGPSGSGKTTLLRLIAGLEAPDQGRVFFDDDDITAYEVQDRDLGFVFQGYALFKHMTVADNITFGPRMRKMEMDMQAKVNELLELTDLPGLGGRFPPQLSGGQRQRVAVARALACNPRLMLLDEPFGALDPIVRKSLRHGLRDIVRRVGVTTIIVTHDQEEAWDIADQVVIFNRGRIEQRGTPKEVGQAPASPFVMNFVGDVNHVPASCQFVRKVGFHTDKPFVMCRPSDYEVHTTFEGVEGAAAATVHDKANVGKLVRYYLRFDDGVDIDIAVSRRVDEQQYDMEVGQRVLVGIQPSRMMGFDYSELDASASVV
ncbi:sulfate ABC transporter ATP-binding [Micractinium conductrix]|uniref:Sulfate ABC transporter ATP-binding n=1 Tax=Micractinium conductrix TaxID=554055 RepID=A0A2P6VQL1_9CHLO|nr:sulfate ABC transporter ATP-binding [Micractinium conductrix]|eukprot:PSC76396.1 sulfate ABC transporter ATP-binding [Micractinium conductrix]